MRPAYDVWTDPELEHLVRDEPELVAIADALAQARTTAVAKPHRRRPAGPLAAAAALVAAAAVALIAPWDRSAGNLGDVALAAIGSQPVLHVVAAASAGGELVDLDTGASRRVLQHEEIWYDAERGLKRSVVRVGATIGSDTLETPAGGYTPGGIVYDCAWIAAHPVAATKARVSCSPSGDNGTTPRVVTRPRPTLVPGLAGFVDGYAQALAGGLARDGGGGELDGRAVAWLVFPTSRGSERVALDHATHKPVLLEDTTGWSLRIDTIETVAYDAADFARPASDELAPRPSSGRASDGHALQLEAPTLAAAMPGAVWPGESVGELPLRRAQQQTLTARFADDLRPAETGTGLELVYGTLTSGGRLDRSNPYVQIDEAPGGTLAYAYMWGFVRGDDPPPGQLYLATTAAAGRQVGFTVANGVHVTIQATSRELLLEAARSLHPAS